MLACLGPENKGACVIGTYLKAMRRAAASPCVCNGRWLHYVQQSFAVNQVNVHELCKDIFEALDRGRSESVPVIVLAGSAGGEGKSLFLKALFSVFGYESIFTGPVSGGFPMIEVFGKKVAFLDEWRFNEDLLPWPVQCVWYDGSTFAVARPQNVPGVCGHYQYKGNAPIFATTKLDDLERLRWYASPNPRTGKPRDANASMIWRRLKVYPYCCKIAKPPPNMPFCAHCFASLVFEYGAPRGAPHGPPAAPPPPFAPAHGAPQGQAFVHAPPPAPFGGAPPAQAAAAPPPPPAGAGVTFFL